MPAGHDRHPDAPPPGALTTPGTGEPAWRRVHKLTPLLNAWQFFAALVAIIAYQSIDFIVEIFVATTSGRIGVVLLVVGLSTLVATALAVGYSLLAWRFTRYAVTQDAVLLHQGIVFRQQRHARLNRIQAIDVVRPLIARLIGVAQLKIETAGGADSAVVLRYLKYGEAQAVRREILQRVEEVSESRRGPQDDGAGAASGEATGTPSPTGGADSGSAGPSIDMPEREHYRVPAGRLIGSVLLSAGTLVMLLVIGGIIAGVIVADSFAPLLAVLPVLFGGAAAIWSTFVRGFGFRAAVTVDGIKLRHGLLETQSQTVPPGRVHAVELTQPFLWRLKGWWRVTVNVAGYGVEVSSQGSSRDVLLPVGDRGEALTAMWLVLPDLGVDDTATVLDAALTGSGPDGGFVTSPRRARALDPFTWRRNGLTLTRSAMLIRRGRFVRQLSIVPHERTQSLAIEQGPVERAFGLVNLKVGSVPGPVRAWAQHLDGLTALSILGEQATRVRTASRRESPRDWQRRVGVLPAHPEMPAAGVSPVPGFSPPADRPTDLPPPSASAVPAAAPPPSPGTATPAIAPPAEPSRAWSPPGVSSSPPPPEARVAGESVPGDPESTGTPHSWRHRETGEAGPPS